MKLSASLYAADPMRLGQQVEAVTPHVGSLHVDVMDGAFAPAFGLGERIVKELGSRSALPIDVHLMVRDPDRWVGTFATAGARRVAFHLESSEDPRRNAEEVRACGALAYLALLPKTPMRAALPFLDTLDGVLLLTAPPGGGLFDSAALDRLADLPSGVSAIVDGGIEPRHFITIARRPVDLVVVGRTLFNAENVSERAGRLRADLDRMQDQTPKGHS